MTRVHMDDVLKAKLLARKDKGLLRQLRCPTESSIDFSSNDYLGLARSPTFQAFLRDRHRDLPSGATGSRLLSGHSDLAAELERKAAAFHHAPAALLFNSGYDANLSLLSCLPQPDDAIIYDQYIHKSVHDGMRLSRARQNTHPFLHNNPTSLHQTCLKAAQNHSGAIWVAVETVYSMHGDLAPLDKFLPLLQTLSQTLNRHVLLIADEAHAAGIYGPNGQGLAFAHRVHQHPNLFARVVTFGKAFAAHGAVVLGSSVLIEYLINYASTFIYSTALPPHSVLTLIAAYDFFATKEAESARDTLWRRVAYFNKMAAHMLQEHALTNLHVQSPIKALIVPGNAKCVSVSQRLRKEGFDVYPIRSPTVPKGSERIRVIIHAHNTEADILRLLKTALDIYSSRARL